MFSFLDPLRLKLSSDQQTLEVSYSPTSEKPLFDICDLEGRVIKTGAMSAQNLKIKVSDLINEMYIFLILDGDEVRTKRFEISR
jgi:hypothetical protein